MSVNGVGVRFEGVSVSLGGRPVLRDASFEIRAGGTHGVRRARTAAARRRSSGSSSGSCVPARGASPSSKSGRGEIPRPRIGYLSQRSTLAFDAPLSAVDLVAFSLSPKAGFRRSVGRDRRGPHGPRRGRGFPRTPRPCRSACLSGGQRQRVLLARAIAGAPPLLLLDEADTALDADGLATLRRLVTEEVAAGRTVVYVTHDSDAMGGADAVFRWTGP